MKGAIHMYQLIIIDDEENICQGTAHIFPWDMVGLQVAATFTSGKQALEYVHKNHVDVILTDIRMPLMSGLEIAKEINLFNPDIKVVFMSGFSDFNYMKEALLHSVSDYLLKPIRYDELLTCFQRIKEQLDSKLCIKEAEVQPSYYQQIVTTTMNYIKENVKDATLESAAIHVNMSPSYLSRLIKEKSGVNFSTHLLNCRMKKAAKLLRGIEYKQYEIAFLVGYDNPKNFSRAFKQYYGVTPKEFRESELVNDFDLSSKGNINEA